MRHLILLVILSACNSQVGAGPIPSAQAGSGAPAEVTQAVTPQAVATELAAVANGRYRLGARVVQGNLAVWPILDARPASAPNGDFRTLAEAMSAGDLAISEANGGTVPTLKAENKGSRPVLLTVGDVVTGGRQDRVIVADVLLPPQSGPVDIGVNCVEHGRWVANQAGGMSFGYGGKGEMDLKRTLSVEKDQGRTWSKVSELNAAKQAVTRGQDLAPSTGTYRASLQSDGVKGKARVYEDVTLPALSAPDTVGVIVAVDGKVVSAELFGTPALFAKSRTDLVRSVALDAVSKGADTATPPEDAEASTFLADALAGKEVLRDKVGAASRVEVDGEKTRSYALTTEDGEVLHLNAYAE
jgi:hypothetical protein